MRKQWIAGFAVLLFGASIVQGGQSAQAQSAPLSVVSESSSNYGLSEHIRAVIKNAAVEKTANGLQLSATVRVYNGVNVQERLPEHELRVRGTNGLEYTLSASAANKGALQPQEIAELTYKTVIDSTGVLEVASVSFVHVDWYAYPKKETYLLTIPAVTVWYGTGSDTVQRLPASEWGAAFAIPGINSEIEYTTVDVSVQNAGNGRTAVVALLAENKGVGRETTPGFRLDGQSKQKLYTGHAAAQNAVSLEAGEKAYLHFAIPIDNDTVISDLLVVTTDWFVPAAGEPSPIYTGKLAVHWPSSGQTTRTVQPYTIGSPIRFDPLATTIASDVAVSLMELHMHENPDEGYKTAIAKFKVANIGGVPTAMPAFETELTSNSGAVYKGLRQANVVSTMNPGLSYIVSYSYQVPQTENGEGLVVKLLDSKAAAPYTTTIAALQTEAQQGSSDDPLLSVYPFDLKMNSTYVSYTYMNYQYMYKISVDLDIVQRENVVVDGGFSKLRFEIVDGMGRVLGSKDAPFTGTNKLVSGKQTIDLNIGSDQLVSPVTVSIYEVIETGNGTAKRLLAKSN